jgi:hypothetical protein
MQNFVRMTVVIVGVLVGEEISSALASEPVPNLQKLAASLVDWVVGC